MPKFSVLTHGSNFLLSAGSPPQKHGFYVRAFVEAADAEEARGAVPGLLRAEPKLRGAVQNPSDDPPRLEFEETESLADWPADCVRPLSGFSFYVDTAAHDKTGDADPEEA